MYDTSVVEKYLATSTIKENSKFYKTTLPNDIILTKEDYYTNDEKVEVLSREYNIYYRACMGSLIYILSTIMDFSPSTSWQNFHQILVKYILRVWYTF